MWDISLEQMAESTADTIFLIEAIVEMISLI